MNKLASTLLCSFLVSSGSLANAAFGIELIDGEALPITAITEVFPTFVAFDPSGNEVVDGLKIGGGYTAEFTFSTIGLGKVYGFGLRLTTNEIEAAGFFFSVQSSVPGLSQFSFSYTLEDFFNPESEVMLPPYGIYLGSPTYFENGEAVTIFEGDSISLLVSGEIAIPVNFFLEGDNRPLVGISHKPFNIPEPSSFAIFAGLGVFGLALNRRRR